MLRLDAAVRSVPVLAVIDSCVLYAGKVTDFLLCLAEAGAFDPLWSHTIHDEWSRNLAARLPAEKIAHRRAEMDRAFPAASIPVDAALIARISSMCANAAERKDAHVMATAVKGGAAMVITENIRDFPRAILAEFGLDILPPDAFCRTMYDRNPGQVVQGAAAHRASMLRHRLGAYGYLDFLASRAMLPDTARALGPHVSEI